MRKEILKDELKDLAPKLDEWQGRDTGFKVPEGYFDQLEDRIFSRIEAAGLEPKPASKSLKKPLVLRIPMSAWLSVAASVVAILGAVWFFSPEPAVEPAPVAVELSDEEIEQYLLNNLNDLEEDQLALLPVEEEENNETPLKPSEPAQSRQKSHQEISTEDIEQILNDMTDEELEEIL